MHGFGYDLEGGGQVSEQFSIRLGKDLRLGSIARPADDGDGVENFDLSIECLPLEHDRKQKPEVLEAAAGLEGYQAQFVVVDGSAGGEIVEYAAEVADANGQQLRHLDHARPMV